MQSTAFELTKWSLHLATRLIKADMRVHDSDALDDDMSIIFVVNHFTRLETLLLPYVLHQKTGRIIWSLAADELFKGRIGRYLNSTGAVSTKAPDRDTTIVHSLLSGEKSWIIFPEGAMIKDKKLVDRSGQFEVYNQGHRRAPHTGAAVLALRTEYYRQKLRCLRDRGDEAEIEGIREHFKLESVDAALEKRTCIVPVNITYYPVRAQENVVLRGARAVAKDLSPRAIEELSLEGTLLSQDTDIDINLGAPIEMKPYLDVPEYAEMMACRIDDYAVLKEQEADPSSAFREGAHRIMVRYMSEIYRLTTVNYDHLVTNIIRHQRVKKFDRDTLRSRVFVAAERMQSLGHHRIHELLINTYRDLVFDEPSPKLEDILNLALKESWIAEEDGHFVKQKGTRRGSSEFHQARMEETSYVIANEIEPLNMLVTMLKDVAHAPQTDIDTEIREHFVREDNRIFEEDYAAHGIEGESKPPHIGKPFLLMPKGPVRAGVVLTHGYMAAPEEVRQLAESLCHIGYAVYGVRLRGHGTSPEDLQKREWEEWYESLNRGYAVIRSISNKIILGGFSTGGVMSLLAAGRKQHHVRAVFSICAPLALQSFGARFAPTIVSMNALIRKVRKSHSRWGFVENFPENAHINYNRNPLHGVRELSQSMDALRDTLPEIRVPAFVVQGSGDPVVKPTSGQMIFDSLGSKHKELCILHRDRHGIINGDGSDVVFERVQHFLKWALELPQEEMAPAQNEPAKQLVDMQETPELA